MKSLDSFIEKKFNQQDIIKPASKVGVPIDKDGNCTALSILYAAHEIKHVGREDKDFVAKLNRNIVSPNDNFFKRVMLYQTHFGYFKPTPNLGKIKVATKLWKETPFRNLIPYYFEKNKFLRLDLYNKTGDCHVIVVQVLKGADGECKYKLFDPNVGESKELTDIELKQGLNYLLKDFYRRQYNFVEIRDGEQMIMINKLLTNKGKYLDEKKLLHLARNAEQFEYLWGLGANEVNYVSDLGNKKTSLHYALEFNHNKTFELLMEKGAEVDVVDWCGNSCLYLAAEQGNKYCLELLIERGANTEIKNEQGKTALDIAQEKGNKAIIEILTRVKLFKVIKEEDRDGISEALEQGAKIIISSRKGWEALFNTVKLNGISDAMELFENSLGFSLTSPLMFITYTALPIATFYIPVEGLILISLQAFCLSWLLQDYAPASIKSSIFDSPSKLRSFTDIVKDSREESKQCINLS
ncbi:hypothetical protein NF27_IN00740 [Candidatus Jidaibacter acanthamoeba]|uniref:Uncharacterized protein n=1 Tax=Candidatus Jidaibacter acanthamoebae TaxID=86105 RepID=A0A0C1QJG9_9RICK|nr:ankyrin repeat domain-containing protein [Candidatus Jidaibacter acanthamoeba]KIE04333.1 hypothetical protein NF27_IN00740 [Candidatus Jidaibacter acanthamoeba]